MDSTNGLFACFCLRRIPVCFNTVFELPRKAKKATAYILVALALPTVPRDLPTDCDAKNYRSASAPPPCAYSDDRAVCATVLPKNVCSRRNRAKLTTFFAILRLPLGGGFLFGLRRSFLPLLLVSDMRLCNKCTVNLHTEKARRRIRVDKKSQTQYHGF